MGERLFYILKILKQQTKPISAKNICDMLVEYHIHMDIKTVYSTIERINGFYTLLTGDIYIQVIHRKGYIIKNHYFKDGELQFLLDSIYSNPNLNNQEIRQLEQRLLTISSAEQMQHLSLYQPKEKNQSFSLLLNLSTLLKAVIHRQPVYFQYVSYKINNRQLEEVYSNNGNVTIDEQSYYLISPYKVVLRNGHYYVLGYFDRRKGQMSMYRVDRMRFVRNHKSKFIDISEQFDVEKELEKNVNMFVSDRKIDVTFKFKNNVLREVVNQFGTDMEVINELNQWNIAKVKNITLSDGLLGWIMMLQDQVEIILPLELRDMVIDKIQRMTNIYQC